MNHPLDDEIDELEAQLEAENDQEQALRDRYLRTPSERVARELGDARAARKETANRVRDLKAERAADQSS